MPPRAPRGSKRLLHGVLIALVIVSSLALGMVARPFWDSRAGDTQTGQSAITIIEYSDFQCPFCQRAVATVRQIEQAYGGRVTVVYKHFPLESIHPDALNAAIAAECVREIDGEAAFWTYHDTLFANQQALDLAKGRSAACAAPRASGYRTSSWWARCRSTSSRP